MFCALALGYASCTKEIVVQQPTPTPAVTTPTVTLEQSSRLPSRTVMPNDSVMLQFEHIVRVTAVPGGSIATVILHLAASNGLSLASLTHVTAKIKDTHGNSAVMEGYANGQPNMEFPISFALSTETDIDTVRIWAIVANTVRGTVSGTEQVQCYSTALAYKTTDPVATQTVTFDAAVLNASLSSLTPNTKLVLDAVADSALAVTFTADGGDLPLTEVVAVPTSPSVIQMINVYDGTNLVGFATVNDQSSVAIPISLTILSGTTKTLVFKQMPKTITDISQSRSNVKLGIASYTYTAPDGSTYTKNIVITGNDLYLVKAYPKIVFIPENNTTIINGVERTFLHFTVTAIGGPIAWKSEGTMLTWADQSPYDTTVLKYPTFLRNGIVQDSTVTTIYNAAGFTDSVYGEDASRIFPTWRGGSNEDMVLEGQTVDYKQLMTPDKFGIGDGVTFTVPKDDAGTITHSTLGLGASGYIVQLKDPSTLSLSMSSFIWTDLSAGASQNANPLSPSNDFFGTDLLPGFTGFVQGFNR